MIRKIMNLLRLVFYSFITIVGLGILGINLLGLLAGAGFLGIILGLALQTPMSNGFAGMYITLSKTLHEKDLVKINAIGSNIYTIGTVQHIGFSHTELLSEDGIIKLIPNNLILTSIIERHPNTKDDTNVQTPNDFAK